MAITGLTAGSASQAQADDAWWRAIYPTGCSGGQLDRCAAWVSIDVAIGSRFSCFGDSCAVKPNDEAVAAQVKLWSHLIPGADHSSESEIAVSGYNAAVEAIPGQFAHLRDGTIIEQRYYEAILARVKANLGHARNWASGAQPPPTVDSPAPPNPPAARSFRTVLPNISGSAKVGKTLKTTSESSKWSPRPASVAYQWMRNGAPISGATKSKYKLVGADYKAKITVTVTGSKSGYTAASRSSKATKSVKAGTLKRGKVNVVGIKQVSATLTAKTYGKWSSRVAFTYQWYRGKTRILGATTKTYVLAGADRGKKIKVKVIATKPGYGTRSTTSNPVRIA